MAHAYNDQLDAFELYHKSLESSSSPLGGPALPALGHAISGSAGSAISHLITYPLTLVVTRLQVQRQLRGASSSSSSSSGDDDLEYKSLTDAFRKIYEREGGISAFYSGVLPDTAKAVADSFLFFLAYNFLRTSRQRSSSSSSRRDGSGGSRNLPMADELAVGVLAAAFSKLLTTPIQNVVTRKQTAAMAEPRSSEPSSKGPTTRAIARQIHAEKGLQGFWSGYSASLVLTLNPSLTFLLHEAFLRMLPAHKRKDPGARLTFLLAAASKAIASALTYPFSLAKARAQVSGERPVATTSSRPSASISDEKDSPKGRLDKLEEVVKARARRDTIFGSILEIARTEGVAGLYQGLGAEVLKGFFAHGLTMLMKERIHGAAVQLYYLVLRALRRYPSPMEMAQRAGTQVKETAEGASERVQTAATEVSEKASNLASGVSDKASNLATGAQTTMQSGVEKGKEMFQSGAETVAAGTAKAKDMVAERYEQNKSAAGDAYAKGKDVVSGQAAKASDAASSAGSMAQNVTEKGRNMMQDATDKSKEVVSGQAAKAAAAASSVGSAAQDATGKARDVAQNATDTGRNMVQEASEKGRDMAHGTADKSRSMVQDASDKGRGMLQDASEKGRGMAQDATDKSRDMMPKSAPQQAVQDTARDDASVAVSKRSTTEVVKDVERDAATPGDVYGKKEGVGDVSGEKK